MFEGRLFVTGATGFLGSHLIPRLHSSGLPITFLSRSPGKQEWAELKNISYVAGDLRQPETYRHALRGCDAVVHLAALTGKASKQAHFAFNLDATERLLEESRSSGVRRFLFVSTIAVKYPDLRRYYYAQAKAGAEVAVQASGLPFLIARPTIVIGKHSPVLAALSKLSRCAVIPMFGAGQTLVQPVYVEDVAEMLVDLLSLDRFDSEIVEVGGPEVSSMEAFLQAICRCYRGRSAHTVHLPLSLMNMGLGVCETLIGPKLLPLTSGQLSLFRFDSTATANPFCESRRDRLKTIEQMLELSVSVRRPRID